MGRDSGRGSDHRCSVKNKPSHSKGLSRPGIDLEPSQHRTFPLRRAVRAGDFLFAPPGIPHEAVNLSATEADRAVVARNDLAEQDKVEPYLRNGASQ